MNYKQLTNEKKVQIDISTKYDTFLRYLYTHYDYKTCSIEICMMKFKKQTVLPISFRPKYINKRDELGHLEIDSIIGKRNEYDYIISIVDRCSRRVWLIKAEYKNEYYIDKIIYDFILRNEKPTI